MKRHLIVAGCVAALGLAACQKQQTADSAAASDASAAASSADSSAASASASAAAAASAVTDTGAPANPANMAAADFVDMAATSDMYEIQAAKIALKRSKNPDVQALAKMMIQDHTKSTAMIKKAIADSGQAIEPPTTLPNDKQEMIGALNAASAATFDKTYLDQQASAHHDALDLMTGYAASGGEMHLKEAAAKIAPVVQMHIDHIASLQKAAS